MRSYIPEYKSIPTTVDFKATNIKTPMVCGKMAFECCRFSKMEVFWFDNFTVLRLVFSFVTRACPFLYHNNISSCPRCTDIGTFSLFTEIPLPNFHLFVLRPRFTPSLSETRKPPRATAILFWINNVDGEGKCNINIYCTRTYGADYKEKNIEFPNPLQVGYTSSYIIHMWRKTFFRE